MSNDLRDDAFGLRWEASSSSDETMEPGESLGPADRIRALHRALLSSWRLYLQEAVDEHPEQARRALACELLDEE